jgi:hypothetical protein
LKRRLEKVKNQHWGWWYMPVIPALGRLRQDDCKPGYLISKKKERKEKKVKNKNHKQS